MHAPDAPSRQQKKRQLQQQQQPTRCAGQLRRLQPEPAWPGLVWPGLADDNNTRLTRQMALAGTARQARDRPKDSRQRETQIETATGVEWSLFGSLLDRLLESRVYWGVSKDLWVVYKLFAQRNFKVSLCRPTRF